MQITIGDALTVVSVIFGVLISMWALLVAFAVLFPNRADKARAEVLEHPWRAFFVGLAHNAILLFLGVVFTASPAPIAKLIGWVFYVTLFFVIIVGGSGIVLAAAARIQQNDRRRGQYRSIERGAALLVIGSLLPFFGWFAFAPALMTFAGGAGVRAIFGRTRSPRTVRSTQESGAASGEFVV